VENHLGPRRKKQMAHIPDSETLLEFKVRNDEHDLSMPSPDNTKSNQERNGFATEVINDTWKCLLDPEFRNK